jgi:hypothetical protein
VPGVRCSRGHLNHDRARHCLFCGTALGSAGSTVGPRPVVGALVRADGVRVLLREEVAISACAPTVASALDEATAAMTARIVFLGWEPFALAETPGIRWATAAGPAVPLEPGDSAPLLPGVALLIGLDNYRYEPLGRPAEPTPRRSRRRRRLPDRSLFRALL